MRPSKIKFVTAKKAWLMMPNFEAITLFGVVFCASKRLADSINMTDYVDSFLESHETIHVRQAESTSDSWFIYYLKYIWQWICNLPLIFINLYAPYRFIPFELEAFANQNDLKYCEGKCEQWKKFNKLTLKQKRELAKKYYENKIYFIRFVNEQIVPLI